MQRILKESLREFVALYKNSLLFLIVLLLGLSYTALVYIVFIEMLKNYLSYFSLGALIIKTRGLQSLASLLPYFIIGPVVTILSFLSPALLYVYFAIMTVKKKLGRRMHAKELKEKSIKSFAFFIVFYTALSIALALLSPLMLISPVLYSLIAALLFYITFFVPYALIIDDYTWMQAFKKGLIVLMKKPLEPLIWGFALAFFLVFTYLVVNAFTYLAFPNGWLVDRPTLNDLIIFLLNQLFILPFGIVFASHLYVSRYPLVRV